MKSMEIGSNISIDLLPGIPEGRIREALARAGGNEVESGKFASPESSAALAVNTFGWFLDRPEELPLFPCVADLDWPPTAVDIERSLRFPWSGGRHPWLDAVVETRGHLVAIESKRYEPFRDTKTVRLSDAYDRKAWGDSMVPFEAMRDALRKRTTSFLHLDAAQLVKHAFGLRTQAAKSGRRPVLLYLYSEPVTRGTVPIAPEDLARHRDEISTFANFVAGAEVRFAACSYREWLLNWTGTPAVHAAAVLARFAP